MPDKPTSQSVQHAINIMQFFQKDDGQVLLRSVQQQYMDMLNDFTKEGLTAEEVKVLYDRFQGFLALMRSWGGEVGEAKAFLREYAARRTAETHVKQTVGLDIV